MSARTRILERQTYAHFADVRSYTKTVNIEKTFTVQGHEYSTSFECSLRLWTDERFPQVEFVSDVQAFNSGGQQVLVRATLDALYALACMWARDNTDTVMELIQKKGGSNVD